jgi:hypothetical protein
MIIYKRPNPNIHIPKKQNLQPKTKQERKAFTN